VYWSIRLVTRRASAHSAGRFGAAGISAHVITTPEGLILLDTGTKEMLPGLRANIEKLGHKLSDVKIILSSHAHWDHVENHAAMKKLTGAQIMAVGEDAAAISAGIDNSALGGEGWPPAKVDRVLKDGDMVTLGGVTPKAHLTPGHTKGLHGASRTCRALTAISPRRRTALYGRYAPAQANVVVKPEESR
jgi:glyoxylase-like metal-dependent hydrolase (beta-lactamase superfamily II)